MKELYFEEIKEPRDAYFVRYCPPGGDTRFAMLQIVFTEDTKVEDAKHAMEAEADSWLRKYPIPVMVTAFDPDGRVIRIHSSGENCHLIAWNDDEGKEERHWRLLKDEQMPSAALSTENLRDVFHDVPYRTDNQVKAEAYAKLNDEKRGRNILIAIIFGWAVIVPATIAILGWTSPVVGAAATVYALGKAARQGAVLLGFTNRTEREQEEKERQSRMEHYFYHCERNPEAFQQLKAENFRSDSRERKRKQAEELTRPSRATR